MSARTDPARRPIAVLACVLVACLGGCASVPSPGSMFADMKKSVGKYPVGELPPAPQNTRTWSDPATDARGQRARGFGLVAMPDMQRYLNGLYARIKTAAGVPDWPGAVYITARNELDAYCTQAGNMYLSVGWLQAAQSEDEIVALMSHELGHVFADTHKLEGGLVMADRVAALSLIGVAIVKKLGNKSGWTQLDTFMVGYQMARESLAPAWSRGEEEAADRFGATVSLKLGYSYPAGFKTFLERQLTWENDNKARQEALRAQALAQQRVKIAAEVNNDLRPVNDAQKQLASFNIDLNTALAEGAESVKHSFDVLFGQVTNSHPNTQGRLDDLTAEIKPLLAGKKRAEASVKPWETARATPRTAAILNNYRVVDEVQDALQKQDFAAARRLAARAASGDTARHALPTFELAQVDAADGRANANAKLLAALDRNLQSEGDRSWHLYVLRASALLGAGQTVQARKVMSDGFNYFDLAPYAWPDQIAFVGQVDDWDRAKKLASQCAQRFPSHAKACRTAATSPSEIAAQKAVDEAKGKSLANKIPLLRSK